MAQSALLYSLSWDSYNSSICNGFSSFQQNDEFVDMTIAADGHLVKVHQVLIAMASPDLKNMILSVPNQNPVLFLANVSHQVLEYLVNYIYNGNVVVPSDFLLSFVETARSLNIKGLETYNTGNTENDTSHGADFEIPSQVSGVNTNATTSLNLSDSCVSLPETASIIMVQSEETVIPSEENTTTFTSSNQNISTQQEVPDLVDAGTQDLDDNVRLSDNAMDADTKTLKSMTSNLLFTASIRGSFQVVFKRFMYSFSSMIAKTGIRKWRCVDYRNKKCPAFLASKGNVVIDRVNPHNHPFHDNKILKKIGKKSLFFNLNDVQAYIDKIKQARLHPSK